MENIKQFFKNPMYVGVITLVAGAVIGLVGLGWGLWPVQWTDAAPMDLHTDYQRDYLCMTIDSYIRNQDERLMLIRWEGLGEEAGAILDTLTPAVCRFETSTEIDAFKEVMAVPIASAPVVADESVESEGDVPAEESVASEEIILEEAVDPTGEAFVVMEPPAQEDVKTVFILPLAILILATLIVGGILVFLMIKRSKGGAPINFKAPKIVLPKMGRMGKKMDAAPAAPPAEKRPMSSAPIAQFMTTYRQGDDLYDDSFSVDSDTGEFLGECGVGIAETIGVGEPKKVTALEVWLFDKNDIQTITKVMMSEHASNDPSIRQRLQSKGEPIMVEPGMKFLMETATLQLEAKVVDMVYARGPLPENSYFSRLTLEVSVWQK